MAPARCAVVVAAPRDALAASVAAALRARGVAVVEAPPDALADLRVTLSADALAVEGRPVGAVVFRAPPEATFSAGFALEDRAFCDTETRAVWLAASHLPSVLAVNRLDADAWFGGASWTGWRRPLREAGVPLAPFAFGDGAADGGLRWHPYAGRESHAAPGRAVRQLLGAALTPSRAAEACLVVAGEVVEGEATPAATAAAASLAAAGLLVASITTDTEGRVLVVDPLPDVARPDALERAAHLLAELCHAHLRRR